MNTENYFNRLDNLRKNKGWSSNYLCNMAGVSHNTLYTWKKRNTMPTFEILSSLCDVLQISLAQLFSNESMEDLTREQYELLEHWRLIHPRHKGIVKDLIIALQSTAA